MTKQLRIFFLFIFILSTIAGCGLLIFSSSNFSGSAGAPEQEPPAPNVQPTQTTSGEQNLDPAAKPADSSSLALVTSLATSFASLVGFLTTTVITWRKEKRESDLAAMERKKLELELEKNKLELEELRKKKSRE